MLQLNRQCLKGHCLLSALMLHSSLTSKKEGALYPSRWEWHHKPQLKGKQMLCSVGWRRWLDSVILEGFSKLNDSTILWFCTSLLARTRKFSSGVNVGAWSLSSPAVYQEHTPKDHVMVAGR